LEIGARCDQPFSHLHRILDTTEIQSAVAYKNGILELTFNDKSMVIVKEDPHYEAWELAGSGSIKLFSLPGGELAVWL
jgi:frataxin-like iron-binding protein CyaY